MAGSYLTLARRELDRLNMEIEPLQETLNRLTETRDAWATIVRNATPEPGYPQPTETFTTIETVDQSSNGHHAAMRAESVAATATTEIPEEPVDDHAWKINAVREMFRSTYPRFSAQPAKHQR